MSSLRLHLNQMLLWINEHPDNYWGLRAYAMFLLEAKQYERAKEQLRRLIELFPEDTSDNSSYLLLAQAHRGLGDFDRERSALEESAKRDSDVVVAYRRLMELCSDAEDWEQVIVNADRMLAVNPLEASTYRHLATAGQATNDSIRGIEAYRALLELNPIDITDIHFQLGRLLAEQKSTDRCQTPCSRGTRGSAPFPRRARTAFADTASRARRRSI